MECLFQKAYRWRKFRKAVKHYELGISKLPDIFSGGIFKSSNFNNPILYTPNEYLALMQLPCTTASLLKKKILIQCHLFIKEIDKFI